MEFARHPEFSAEMLEELEELFVYEAELTFEALREIPRLEGLIKEVLRIHPPLVLLMRRVIEDIDFNGTLIEAGKTVAVSTYGAHRNEYFASAPIGRESASSIS